MEACRALGLTRAQGRLWAESSGSSQVVRAWQWLRSEVVGPGREDVAELRILLAEVLSGFYLLEHVVFYTLVGFLLPQLLDYERHIGLDADQIAKRTGHHSHFMSLALGSSGTLVIFLLYLTVIHFSLGALWAICRTGREQACTGREFACTGRERACTRREPACTG